MSRKRAWRYSSGTVPFLFTGISYFSPDLVVTVTVSTWRGPKSPPFPPVRRGTAGSLLWRT